MLFCNDNVKFIKMYCITLKDQIELTVTSSSMTFLWDYQSILLYFAANNASVTFPFFCCSATGNFQWSVVHVQNPNRDCNLFTSV